MNEMEGRSWENAMDKKEGTKDLPPGKFASE